jgi:hypothetical protein
LKSREFKLFKSGLKKPWLILYAESVIFVYCKASFALKAYGF